MEKIVESGERITTIVLDGTECAVKFASKYRVFCVKSDSDVTVSLASGKSAGEDGVMVCKAGESIMYPHMRQLDTVYITGSGSVAVYAGNEAVNPFKDGQKGGVKKSDFDALSQNVDDISNDVDLLESRIDAIRNKRLYSLQDAYLSWMNGEKFPIAFAGDSTTDGYGTTDHVDNTLGTDHIDTHAYPYLLQTKLSEECNNNTLRIYNAGFSGQKIGYIIDNFEAEFGSGTPYEDTKMVGISFGINDRVDTIVEYGTFVNDIITLANLCFEKGIQPFLLTCQCICESANGVDPNRIEWENMAYANKAKYEVAKLLDLEILDVSKATAHFIEYSNKPLLQIMHDLCHFGDDGHEFESGFFFSEIVPRTIFANGEMNIGFTTQGIKSDVVFADGNNYRLSILSAVQNGFKTKVASVTGIFTGDIVLLDAWVFIDGKKPLTLISYCDNVNTTHVLIDGVNIALTSNVQSLGTLDLGLHHIVAKSGTSNTVEFYGFKLTEI